MGDPTTARRSRSLGRHVEALDGYRGTALGFVLLYHAEVSFAHGGFFGLTQFFTLSGFLIVSMLLRSNASGGINLRVFWARRFRRLMPAAMLGLGVVAIFGATVATRQQAADLPAAVFAASTYWANWFFMFTQQSYVDLFSDPSPVQHYWSLSIEEQFYFLLPVGMLVLLRSGGRAARTQLVVFGGAAVLSSAWMAFLYSRGASLDRLYYGTDTRLAEMLVGGCLAVALFHRGDLFARTSSRRALGVAGIGAFALMIWMTVTMRVVDPALYRGGFLVFAVASCVAIASVMTGGPLALFMAFRPLAALGRISYGGYLYHWPVFLWLTEARTGLDFWPLFALRVAVTVTMATVSYHFIEMPIRNGAKFHVSRSWVRWSAVPLAAVTIVGATFVTVDRDAPDPLATLRASDSSLLPPSGAPDGVLDVVVIPGVADDPVVDRLVALAAPEDDVEITVAAPFACTRLTDDQATPVCDNWLDEWPRLIREHDPEVVLLYVDDWSVADMRRLSGLPDQELATFAGTTLASGFDLLGANGAQILWATSGADFATKLLRSTTPFHVAMATIEPERSDLRHVIGTRMPDPAAVSDRAFRDTSAAVLLSDAALYQRQDDSNLPRVMVIGDSQARSVGYGLERWGASTGKAVVWNIASEGCGLTADGQVHDASGRAVDSSEICRNALNAWKDRVVTFQPDVVVVLSSIWDLNDRKIDGWDDFEAIGSPVFDEFLRTQYAEVIDTFTGAGGRVVWMSAPCTETTATAGPTPDESTSSAAGRLRHLNENIIEPVVSAHTDTTALFDLDRVLCPDGEYMDSVAGIDQLRIDGTHFSVEGAIWFADTYGEELLRLGGT